MSRSQLSMFVVFLLCKFVFIVVVVVCSFDVSHVHSVPRCVVVGCVDSCVVVCCWVCCHWCGGCFPVNVFLMVCSRASTVMVVELGLCLCLCFCGCCVHGSAVVVCLDNVQPPWV